MTRQWLPFGGAEAGAATPLQRARGLAELALGDAGRANGAGRGRHLALLQVDTLELNLSDPAQRCFDDYELLELLGEGGMGVVYRARQVSLDREVAIKLLSAGPWASRDFIARFEREAQNAARMQHPNIVAIHEVGSFEGLQFFSMQLVRGESLSAKLRRGETFTPRAAAALMRTVTEAVGYAHSLSVLHLDLKPANLLLDEAGTPYVADFGLARRLENALAADNDEVSGTPAYMAPEQAQVRAHKLTAATDIWGLGAILYELLTGQPPFRAETAQDTVKLVLRGTVRAPRRWRPRLPLDLQAIVLRCLNREPAGRYPSARALADDLARFVEGRPVQARPLNAVQRIVRWARREPKLAATVACAACALIAGLVATTYQWRRADTNAHVAQVNARTASERLWDSREEAGLRFMDAGDGWKAAPLLLANLAEMEAQGQRTRSESARKRLGIIRNANPQLIDVLPVPEDTKTLAFSPDASRLAFTPGDVDLHLVDLASGKVLWRLGDARDPGRWDWTAPHHMEFTPDGTMILVSDPFPSPAATFPFGIFMSRVDARTGQWLPPPPVPPDISQVGYSADGRHAITFIRGAGAQVWAGDPWRALSPRRRMPDAEWAGPVLFAADLQGFAFHAPGYHGMGLFDAATLQQSWHLDSTIIGRQTAWAFSPDSHWLALGNVKGEVLVVDRSLRQMRRLSPQPLTQIHELRFSDDGQWLAAAAGKGGVYLWEWPEGRLLVWPFGTEVQPDRVRLDRAHARVLASGTHGSAGLWEVPETRFEMDRGDAVPIGGRLVTPWTPEAADWAKALGDAVAWAPDKDLLAHVAARRVQLERLPPAVLKHAHAAPLKPSTLRFDGRHLVVVEDNRVRLLDALTEKPLRAPFEFPQAPGFAELTRDGRTLVVTSGRMLHAYDVAGGGRHFAPVELANSPQHVEINPDGGSVVIGWLDHDAQGMWEAVEIRNLGDGKRMGTPLRIPGVLDGLLFNPVGTRLLAWNFSRVTLRDGHTLAAVPGPLADLRTSPRDRILGGRRTYAAAFDADDGVWLSQVLTEKSRRTASELRHHDRKGALQTLPVPNVTECIVSLRGGVLAMVADGNGLQLLQPGGVLRALPDVARDTSRSEVAVSADGRWLARAQRDGVVLFDALTGTRIASLRAPLPAPDLVFQLAFSPDGKRLLARSLRNRLLVWNLASDDRATPEIARELALREVAGDADGVGAPTEPTTAERDALRKGDPGAPAAVPAATASIARILPGGSIPPRDPGTPPELLDLASDYTFGFGEVERAASDSTGDYGWLAPGVQRFLGVDYDLRGGIQLESATGVTDVVRANHPPAVTVPSPRPDVAALHLLLLRNPSGDQKDSRLARVDFRYADGSAATRWIRDEVHFWAHWRMSGLGAARMAAFGLDARAYAVMKRPAHVYAARLANPHPERVLRGITIAAMDGTATSTVVLAATIEPRAEATSSRN